MPALIPLISLTVIAILSAVLCRVLIAIAPKDAPDSARKDQAAPVPTSGGLAIAAAIIVGTATVILLDVNSQASPRHFGSLKIGEILPYGLLCLTVLIVGAIDDARPLRARIRLLGLFAICLAAASVSPVFGTVFLPVAEATFPLPIWFAVAGTALWIFVMMNATNFMDGSNGLIVGMFIIMFAALGVRLFSIPDHGLAMFIFATIVIAASAGFLVWNLRGRLYAGDAGSLFIGTLFATLSIFASQDGNIWFPVTLALPILVDVFMTLLWRTKQGHNLLTPHRHHAYQKLISAGWSHIQAALLYWGFTLLCAIAARVANADGTVTSAYTFLSLLGVGCTLWLGHRLNITETRSKPTEHQP